MTTPTLEIIGLSVSYGAFTVLRVPSLRIMPGSVNWLRGDNGSGKSSLLHAIAAVGPRVAATSLKMCGTSIIHYSPTRRARIGLRLVPQQCLTFPRLTVGEHIAIAKPLSNGTSSISSLLNMASPGSVLSGGEVRVLLATAMISPKTRLLMLDEPFAGVDQGNTTKLVEVLRAFITPKNAILATDHTGTIETEFPNLLKIETVKGTTVVDEKLSEGT